MGCVTGSSQLWAVSQARFLKGRQLRQQGKEAESMRELKAAVALDPTHKEAQLFLGAALLIKEEVTAHTCHLLAHTPPPTSTQQLAEFSNNSFLFISASVSLDTVSLPPSLP